MKRFERILKYLVLAFLLLIQTYNYAYSQETDVRQRADSITISLLTCGPRSEVYSLYGHTAIRYQDLANGIDVAVNYGVFSFDKPFFVARFVFGLTDYEIGIVDFKYFIMEYEPTGCGVRQQVLNLTAEEKIAIAEAIQTNYEPQNRVYRYNFFYDNCTTRARDILLDNINGTISYGTGGNATYPSYRELTHEYNVEHRWARFGNDILLGVKADRPTTFEQQQFLPQRLQHDFDKATIMDKSGNTRRLVAKSFWVSKPTDRLAGNDHMPSPLMVMSIIALSIVLCTIEEWRRKANWWAIDLTTMLMTGVCGLILFAMVFSKHPTVSLNLQILTLNPLNLIMAYSVTRNSRKNVIHWWTKAYTALIIAFLICGIFQSYAEGMTIVALSLLFRNISKIYISQKTRHKA